jgi:23S rRNA pseudouridine1911/1915/1917 synthase
MAPRRLELTIGPGQQGKSVNTLLRQELGLSGGAVRRAKDIPGGITLDGTPVFTNKAALLGQTLSVQVGGFGPAERLVPTPGPLTIVYEDEDLLLLHKPAGLTVHPGPGHRHDSLGNLLIHYYNRINLAADFHPVNRLDRGTSGLMVVAKHPHAHEKLGRALHTGAFRRGYLAVCRGTPFPRQGCIDSPIARAEDSPIRRQIHPDGAPARTHYRVLGEQAGQSLVALLLETGRTHQIRVHLSSIGCPLVGDFLYGTEEENLHGRFALHAAYLSLSHPVTGADLRFYAPLPKALSALIPDLSPLTQSTLEDFCESHL